MSKALELLKTVGAGISPLVSAGVGIGSIVSNAANTAAANEANIELAKQQNAYNVEQWKRENAYNTPYAQMQRLKAAGLNPNLVFAGGSLENLGASSPNMVSGVGSQVPYQVDPLTAAQIANLNAQTQKTNAETKKTDAETAYQGYLNKVEELLANSPIRTVGVVGEDGVTSYKYEYGNLHVEIAKRQLEALGLSNTLNNAQLNELLYDIAVYTGSDSYGLNSPTENIPSSTPNFEGHSEFLQGDFAIQRASREIAKAQMEIMQAQSQSREAYNKFIDEHKDNPIVQFALVMLGVMQQVGIQPPSVSVSGKFGHTKKTVNKFEDKQVLHVHQKSN